MDKMLRGLPSSTDSVLNGRIFQKLLSKEPDAQYRSEQGSNICGSKSWVCYCDRYRSLQVVIH